MINESLAPVCIHINPKDTAKDSGFYNCIVRAGMNNDEIIVRHREVLPEGCGGYTISEPFIVR